MLYFMCTPDNADEASWSLTHFDDRLLEISAEVEVALQVADFSASIYQSYHGGDYDSGMIAVDDFDDEDYIENVESFRRIYAEFQA